MKKKEFWEKRKIYTASLGIKPIPLSIEDELHYFVSLFNLGGYTKLYEEFLLKKTKLSKKELDELIMNFIKEKANIKKRENSKEFRKFLAKKILENSKTKEKKERWERYLNEKEFE